MEVYVNGYRWLIWVIINTSLPQCCKGDFLVGPGRVSAYKGEQNGHCTEISLQPTVLWWSVSCPPFLHQEVTYLPIPDYTVPNDGMQLGIRSIILLPILTMFRVSMQSFYLSSVFCHQIKYSNYMINVHMFKFDFWSTFHVNWYICFNLTFGQLFM